MTTRTSGDSDALGSNTSALSRRNFLLSSAGAAAAIVASPMLSFAAAKPSADTLRVGVIGCGGRGTGAAVDSLSGDDHTQVVAISDLFSDRVMPCRDSLASIEEEPMRKRVDLPPSRCFVGWDGYQGVLDSDVDLVILATAPHFRPIHLAAAIQKRKHVFMEKPVAVDATGIRSVIESSALAEQHALAIVSGTQRRHERCYLELMQRIHSGQIGRPVSARCYWNQGGLWNHGRKPEWSDMEWQIRNWLYFTWLSGDHIVEQHVHNIDAVNWALGGTPLRCTAMGGRQVRTDPAYGHVFDHFAVEYEYANGVVCQSACRQIDGTAGRVEEVIVGTEGTTYSASGRARIEGKNAWKFNGENGNPYVDEHRDLVTSIRSGRVLNEGKRIAESTLTAIMGRMSAYTGKQVTWEQAMASKENLAPPAYEFGPLPVAPVPIPGRTPLV